MRADGESRAPISPEVQRRLLTEFTRLLSQIDIVVLSDYAKGALTESLVAEAVSLARAADKPLIVDPKARSFAKYRGATALTPNLLELRTASGLQCDGDEELVAGARRTLDEAVCDAMVVTRSRDGLSVIERTGAATHLRTAARGVFDVSGAGDTVVAALSLGLAAGGNIVDAATLANLAAGIVVGKRGTAVVTTGEIMGSLRPLDGHGARRKIFSRDDVLQLTGDWRRSGLRIAFTNGCFDLLHPGHVSLLDQARQTADRLIVGLNSDLSTRRLKGPGRPVQGEVARATLLASLEPVDAVVIFAEDTPLRLIEAVLPDVLIKGADYAQDTIVGADVVTRNGGRVVLADLVEGQSTTAMVERVAGSS